MNTSTIALKPIRIGNTSVSDYLPGLRDKFLAPEADLALVRYEGMLGARIIGDAELLTRKGKYVAFDLPDEARREFTELCAALLDSRFPEWAQAEGAEGRFVWDLTSDSLAHNHSLRFLREGTTVEEVQASDLDSHSLSESEVPF